MMTTKELDMEKKYVDNIFLSFWIQKISPNKKYTIKNDGYHWFWYNGDEDIRTAYQRNYDGVTKLGREFQKGFSHDCKQKDIVWIKVEYKFNDREDMYKDYKEYVSLPIKVDEVNKLIKIICGHQLSINRKVSPNIMVSYVNGNFKYPYGL